MPLEAVYVDPGGVECRVAWDRLAGVALEWGRPVRRFPSYRGQRSYPGLYWSATTGGHVGYESWVERDHLVALDFDRSVVGIASQPFWLVWRTEAGGERRHAPDFFVRRAGGGAVVIDSRPAELIEPEDAAAFAVTERACRRLGWDYAVWDVIDPLVAGNLRWLAGYRHPRCMDEPTAVRLREVFVEPVGLMAGAALVGDPIAVLPVLYHLLWCGDLVADLSLVLSDRTVVRGCALAAAWGGRG
jgi:hypothetical protein